MDLSSVESQRCLTDSGYAPEDPHAHRAARLSAHQAAVLKAEALPTSHRGDSQERSAGAPQAAAHGQANLRAITR